MRQSRTMSMVEAAANVVVGYVLAIATQIVVFPWFGIETGLAEHMTIGLAFVGVSLALVVAVHHQGRCVLVQHTTTRTAAPNPARPENSALRKMAGVWPSMSPTPALPP